MTPAVYDVLSLGVLFFYSVFLILGFGLTSLLLAEFSFPFWLYWLLKVDRLLITSLRP